MLANGSAEPARPSGECLRQVGGIDLTVLRQPYAAAYTLGANRRPALLDGGRIEQRRFQAVALGGRVRAPDLVPASVRAGQHDRAALQEAGLLTGLVLETSVELGAVLSEARHVRRRAELADESRGMPGRAAGESIPLQKQYVGPPPVGEMIGYGAPDHAAADDRDLGSLGYGLGHRRLSFVAVPARATRRICTYSGTASVF
ncbi:MAG: hypothetical protein MAG794_01799 [Gammaproteobacteria bacterium]|nr:hypothetical protein [Gammaproteobacteria bacterium]